MARKPTGNPTGRPAKDFDKGQFEQLCKMHCTQEEICAWFKTTDKTLGNWTQRTYGEDFSETYKKLIQEGKISQRRNLYKLAEKSAAVAIFLAKNQLGMKDEQAIEHKGIGIQIINDIPIGTQDGSTAHGTDSTAVLQST